MSPLRPQFAAAALLAMALLGGAAGLPAATAGSGEVRPENGVPPEGTRPDAKTTHDRLLKDYDRLIRRGSDVEKTYERPLKDYDRTITTGVAVGGAKGQFEKGLKALEARHGRQAALDAIADLEKELAAMKAKLKAK